jgi:hypothetical protein
MRMHPKKMALIALVMINSLALLTACRADEKPPWVKQKTMVEAAKVDPSLYPLFTRWLGRHAKAPVEFIVQACRKHNLVVIGEHHYVRNYLALVRDALPETYRRAGVRVLALEVCNAEDNAKLERLVTGKTYDQTLALEIARDQDWGLWGYKEYWDLLQAVWRLNWSLPEGAEPMRVVGIDKQMDFQLDSMWRANLLKDPALIEKAKSQPDIYKRDDWLVENIEKEILAPGARGLVLIGFNHSFTHYAQPKLGKDGKLEREWPRTTRILYEKYGDKIYQIGLHGPYMSPGQIDKTYKGPEPVIVDLIEKIMAAHDDKPVGFEVVSSPFDGLRDEAAYYFHWQPKVKFGDLCQAFIFLKPIKQLSPCTWMENYISDEMFEKSKTYYESSYGRKFASAKEVNDFFKAGLGSF